jgi:hypothetical protein
MEQNQEMMA